MTFPHLGLYPEKTIDQKARTPQQSLSTASNSQDTLPAKSPRGIKLKQGAVHTYTADYFSLIKTITEIR